MAEPIWEEKLVPVGGLLILNDTSKHPAELYPNTTWEYVKNQLYVVVKGRFTVDPKGTPTGDVRDVYVWKRLS